MGLLLSSGSTALAAERPWPPSVLVTSGSAPSGADAVGTTDPKAPAPLFDIGRVDPSTMDPTQASNASAKAGLARPVTPPKDAPVTAVSGSGEFDSDADAAVKANGFASVKLAGKRKGSKRVGVKVDVRDQAETAKLGGKKLSIAVSRTDDGTETEDVEVTLNYDSFRDTFGSDAIYRLRVVQLSACQGQRDCNETAEPVAASNDFANGALKATVSLKAKPVGSPTAAQAASVASSIAAVPVTGPVVSLALVTAPSGDTGNYTATPLTGSTRWDVSGNSGSFYWSYPFTPVPATGPTPSISLGYNSQMVDDLTANSNTQGGLAGPGWDLMGGGYIERSYRSCGSDTPSTTSNTFSGKSDLCWVLNDLSGVGVVGGGTVDNQVGYSINLNGKVSPLLKQGTTNNFVLKTDPLWKVNDAATGTAVTTGAGSPTADNDGEHFTVKTPDGWTYEFGSDPSRNSVWAVPVFANSANEPCANTTAATSWCYQGYRFMLDKVTDPFGNRMTYTYTIDKPATDQQYISGITNSALAYVRGGYISQVDYGYAPGATLAAGTPASAGPASMRFGYQNRCAPTPPVLFQASVQVTSACDSIIPEEPAGTNGNYPDAPIDLVCRVGLTCSAALKSPVFFQTKRLATVATYVGASVGPVDTWVLNHEWITADGGVPNSNPPVPPLWKLWLRSIQRTTPINVGVSSSALPLEITSPQPKLPYVYFNADYIDPITGTKIEASLQNRVDANVGGVVPTMKFFRLAQIIDEFGGRTDVRYGQDHPCSLTGASGQFPFTSGNFANYATEPRDCYKIWYSNLGSTLGYGGFNKWFVKDVYQRDPVAGNPDVQTRYDYGIIAWHRADADVVQTDVNAKSLYNVSRGAESVTVTVGNQLTAASVKTRTKTSYLTGMNGDNCDVSTVDFCTTGKRAKSWSLAFGQTDTTIDVDSNEKAGQVRTIQRMDGAQNDQYRTYFHYTTQNVILNGFEDSIRVLQDRVYQWDNTFGTFQERRTDTNYNANSYPDAVMEYASSSTSTANATGAARCTATTYEPGTTNATGGSVPFRPISVKLFNGTTFTGACTGTQQSQTDTAYNANSQPISVAKYSAASTVALRTFALYDTRGRVIEQSTPTTATAMPSAPVQKTITGYSEVGSLINSITTTDPTLHSIATDIQPAHGVPTKVVDIQNTNATTVITYDGLGRRTGVWLPGNNDWGVPGTVGAPSAPNPDFRFSYSIPQPQDPQGYGLYTTTEQREDLGRYIFSRVFLDGQGRPRETQALSPSVNTTLVNYSRYDDRGMMATDTSPFPVTVTGGPAAATAAPISGSVTPTPAGSNPLVSTTKTYDDLGRLSVTNTVSNGTVKASTTEVTSGALKIVYPPTGQLTYSHVDAYGRVDSSAAREVGCCTGDLAMVRAANPTDVMVLFGIGVEGDLWRKQQVTSRNGQWSEWTRMSTGKSYSRVSAVVRTNPGQPLSVVALNTAGGFDAYTETATPGVWNPAVAVSVASGARTDIAVAALPSGVLRVFSLSTTGVPIQYTESTIGGAAWTSDGTVTGGGPSNTNVSATRFSDGRIALAARNTAGEVWVARQAAAGAGAMTGFVNAPTGSVTDIDLETKPGGLLLYVVGVGAGGIVYQRSETTSNTWGAWAATGGTSVQNITVDQYAAGDLFTAVGYTAAAWVNGSVQGTVQVNTQNAAGGAFNAAFSDVVNDRTTTYAYDVRDGMTSMTDASGNVTTNAYDWLGRKTSNHDPDMSSTTTSASTYTYVVNTDGTSQQIIKDPVGTEIRTKSDIFGRPIFKDKMVVGTATVAGTLAEWRYDNVAATTNSMGKLVSASACDGSSTTACFGQASEIRNTMTGYDTRGRTTAKQLSGTGLPATLTGPYNFAYTYDDANHVLSQTYPSQADSGGVAETVNQSYYADGRPFATLSTLATYVGATNYYSTGLIATRFLGVNSADNKGAQRWFTYDDRYRVQSLIGRRNTNTAVDGLQQDSYGYDNANQITSINHGETGGTDQGVECFRYDQRNRLSHAWTIAAAGTCAFNATGFNNYTSTTGGITTTGTIYGAGSAIASTAPYNKSYAYDPTGNVLYQGSPTSQAGGGIEPGGYTYPAQGATSVLPHAVAATTQGAFSYNSNGSMTQRAVASGGNKQCIYWNSENRVESMTATTTAVCPVATTLAAGADGDRYRYDANGQRVSRTTKTGATTKTTIYLDGMAEITLTTSASPSVTNRTKYYTSGGATVATRKDGVVNWLFADIQRGVAVSVPNSYDNTPANLTGLQRQRYLPYGQRRGATAGAPGANDNITTTDRGFIAQIEDTTGLNFLTNRYYDPVIGRFTSVDPLVESTREAYLYARNNPITFADPTGLCSFWNIVCQTVETAQQVGAATEQLAQDLITGKNPLAPSTYTSLDPKTPNSPEAATAYYAASKMANVEGQGFYYTLSVEAALADFALSAGGEAAASSAEKATLRRAFTFGNPGEGALGATDKFGNITIRRGLPFDQFMETLRHETVHSILSPRNEMLANARMWVYSKSQLWRFGEEAAAEAYATRSLVKGIRFPINSPYYGLSAVRVAGEAVAVGAAGYGACKIGKAC
jgi:RHS repeat-associated protein